MVGVVKQKKKATGEIIEYTIEMGRKITSKFYEEQVIPQFLGGPRGRGGRAGNVLRRSAAPVKAQV